MPLQLGRFGDVLRRKMWESVDAVHVNSMTLRQSTNCWNSRNLVWVVGSIGDRIALQAFTFGRLVRSWLY